MTTISNDKIDKLLKDISSIKSTINRNKPVFQQIFSLVPFRWLMLFTSLSVIGFSLFIYFLVQNYGGFSSIPTTLKYIIYFSLAADAVILQIFKLKSYSASVKQIDPVLTLGWWFREFYSSKIAHIYISLVILLIFFCIIFIIQNVPYFIIPTISIGFALISICFGVMLQIKYSLIIGYWFLLTGMVTVIFDSIPAAIVLTISVGGGFLLMSLIGFLSSKSMEN